MTLTRSVTPLSTMTGVRALRPRSASAARSLAVSTGCAADSTVSLIVSIGCSIAFFVPAVSRLEPRLRFTRREPRLRAAAAPARRLLGRVVHVHQGRRQGVRTVDADVPPARAHERDHVRGPRGAARPKADAERAPHAGAGGVRARYH